MTLERWYHRAAILIWPRDRHLEVLCDAGTDAAIGGLQQMVNRLKRISAAKRLEKYRECLALAAAIIDTWQPTIRSSWDDAEPVKRSVFLSLLQQLDVPDLLRRFLSQIMVDDGGIRLDNSFGKFAKQHGWASFEYALTSVIKATTTATLNRNAELLATLCLRCGIGIQNALRFAPDWLSGWSKHWRRLTDNQPRIIGNAERSTDQHC